MEQQQAYEAQDDAIENGTFKERRAAKKAQHQQMSEASPEYRGVRGVWTRIKDWFELHPPAVLYGEVMEWLYAHSYVAIILCVIFVAIGLLFNRYISFFGACLILLLGWRVSKYDEDYDGFLFYGAALFTFVVPYLF